MESLWERFDDIAKPENVIEAKAQFTPIEPGKYHVTLEHIEAGLNRNGSPMLKTRFRIIESNRLIFSNINLRVLGYPQLTDENVAEALMLIEGLIGDDIEYTGLKSLEDAIINMPLGTDHYIEVAYGSRDTEKRFPEVSVVEQEGIVGFETADVGDEDTPF